MACRSIRIILVAFLCLFKTTYHCAQVTFVIDQLPSATPPEDTIFISGTFNDWALNDPRFMLQKRLDGKLAITIPSGEGTFQYKFHRGSWAKVETNKKNEYITNREFTFGTTRDVAVVIHNWQDVGGARQFDYFILYFFGSAILALTAVYLIAQIKNRKLKFAIAVRGFMVFIAAALIGRVVFEFSSLKWQYYYALAGDVLLFMSGPLWFFMVQPANLNTRAILRHFLPAVFVLFIIALKVVNVGWLQFLSSSAAESPLSWNAVLFFGTAFLSNCLYAASGIRKTMRSGESSPEKTFTNHQAVLAAFFLLILMTKAIFLFYQSDRLLYIFDRDLIFIYSTFFVWLVAYHVVRNEEAFRATSMHVKSEDLEGLKNAVHKVMKEKKAFKNPHLTLTEFADIVNIKPHLLSKVINECYRQNFRDFVNKYRVEEFIELARQDSNRRYTFLALANEVGFNSKSTFNAAFKKVTHRSPRDFFKSHKMLAD